ncbi:MAG: M14 family metallocarboxypeptidase [Verrucomicrobiales bacterium]
MRKRLPTSSVIDANCYQSSHRAHDYAEIVRRWKAVAKAAKLRIEVIAEQGGYRVYGLKSRAMGGGAPLYVSAGCHGDEPAAVAGLLEWAEENVEQMAHRPLMLFPCLNPWGLVNNTRHNHEGLDLNRQFHDESHPLITAWRKFIEDFRFPVSLTLHEDYDANGIYLYELNPCAGRSYGEPLLQQCEQFIPREWRVSIEGRKAKCAIVRRTRGVPKLDGMPEAVMLFAEQGGASLTFETPSEFGLFDRVRAHKAFVAGLFEMTH